MTKDVLEYRHVQHDIVHKMNPDHLKIAFKAKMTHYEISVCKLISDLQHIPIEQIFRKMAVFKESSDYIVYKKDFIWNGSN